MCIFKANKEGGARPRGSVHMWLSSAEALSVTGARDRGHRADAFLVEELL